MADVVTRALRRWDEYPPEERYQAESLAAAWIGSTPEHLFTPGVFKNSEILYVGASKWRAYLLNDFAASAKRTTVLEIFPENVQVLDARWARHDRKRRQVVEGNVLTAPLPMCDIAIWHHGPEHLGKTKALDAIRRLSRVCSTLVLGMPEGENWQGAAYGNEAERHLSAWTEDELKELGFRTDCRRGHISAVRQRFTTGLPYRKAQENAEADADLDRRLRSAVKERK